MAWFKDPDGTLLSIAQYAGNWLDDGTDHPDFILETHMNPRGTGLALIVVGAVFIAISSRPPRSGSLGMVAGALFILAGLIRIMRAPRG